MIEVVPGIHEARVPIPDNPLGYTNVYLVQGDRGYLLVDAGWNSEEAFQALKKQLGEVGVEPKDIVQIVVTHGHADHYGLVGKLRQLSGAKIFTHYLEKGMIDPHSKDMEILIQKIRQWFLINGAPDDESLQHLPPFRIPGMTFPVLPDITLHGGETISTGVFSFQVLWTPGHAPGHICLYEPTQKILFSGDHILPIITPAVRLQPRSTANPLANFINSLNMVKQLEVKLVLPAHEHLFTNLQARVEEILQHHEHRIQEILAAIKTKAKTAYEISAEVTWMPELGGVPFRELLPGDKRAAVLESLAHLELMRVEGRANKLLQGDIMYYQSA